MDVKIGRLRLASLSLLSLLSLCWLHSPAAAAAPVAFEPARRLDDTRPYFPRIELSRGHEGWVVLSYVVGEDGTARDVIVEKSNGISAFERAARAWIEGVAFEPARRDGVPVAQSFPHALVTFEIEGGADSSPTGALRRFRQGLGALLDGDLERAGEVAAELRERDGLTLREQSRVYLLDALYAQAVGNDAAALNSMRYALLMGTTSFEPELKQMLARGMFATAIGLRRFNIALAAYDLLERSLAPVAPPAELVVARAQILALRDAGEDFEVVGTLWPVGPKGADADTTSDVGLFSYVPLRSRPALVEVDGTLDSLEIRCDHQVLRTTPRVGVAWNIPPGWGTCELYFTGSAGTRVYVQEMLPAPPAGG